MAIIWDELQVFLIDNTDQILTLASASLEHGKFSLEPGAKITKKQKDSQHPVFTAQSRDASLAGVKGIVLYNIISDTEAKLRIEFDIPNIGSNSLVSTIDGNVVSYQLSALKGSDWSKYSGVKRLAAFIQLDFSNNALLVTPPTIKAIEEEIIKVSEAIGASARIPHLL